MRYLWTNTVWNTNKFRDRLYPMKHYTSMSARVRLAHYRNNKLMGKRLAVNDDILLFFAWFECHDFAASVLNLLKHMAFVAFI